jgi:hypothetical protein
MTPARDARVRTPLAPWFSDAASLERTRQSLGRTPRVFVPRDRSWRALAPRFAEMVDLIRIGLPFQIAAHRRYDRSGRAGRLAPALATGKTVFIPQVHQILPRVMRLIVALRTAFVGTGREECSFLFLVEGRGREGLGLHHDGDVVSFWLQLEGRRTVTLGPPVPPRTPQELPDERARGSRFTTRALAPGTLLYLPPRTPHRVVCYGRSLALSLTWSTTRRRSSSPVWDVVSGRVRQRPRASRSRFSTQVPVTVREHGSRWTVGLPDGGRLDVPAADGLGSALTMMAQFRADALGAALPALREHGVVAPEELPQVIVPDTPRALEGWRFA